MNVESNSVSAVIINYAVTVAVCNFVNSICNVADAVADYTGSDSGLKTFGCYFLQLANLRIYVSNQKRMSCITDISVHINTNVNTYKVTVFDYVFF